MGTVDTTAPATMKSAPSLQNAVERLMRMHRRVVRGSALRSGGTRRIGGQRGRRIEVIEALIQVARHREDILLIP
jgi:hypothetical protein